MRADDLLRAVRRARKLSQRELAERVGVSRSTVDRIESGRAVGPRLDLIELILSSTGYALSVVDGDGGLLDVAAERRGMWDSAGRAFPAHLPLVWISDETTPWWGWYRVAWSMADPKVPTFSFYRRRAPFLIDAPWEDAT